MRTHEILVAGRNYIARHGWTQGYEEYDHGGPACAAVACGWVADGDLLVFSDARNAAQNALAAAAGVSPHELPEWNDADERTEAEVLAAFDRAIAATAPAPDLSLLAADAPLLERVGA